MVALAAVSLLLALAAGLLFWDHSAKFPRQAVLHRLSIIGGDEHAVSQENSTSFASVFHFGSLERHFEILGWRSPQRKLIYVALAFAAMLVVQSFLLGTAANILIILVVTVLLIKGVEYLANRTTSKFLDDFPEFVDRLRQLVIAGNSVTNAFDKALKNGTPIQQRFLKPVSGLVAHGMPLHDALHQRACRLNSPDLFLLSAIVRTCIQFGGDISSSLSHFETILRNRIDARSEVKAMTAELKMTAAILLALPFLTAGGIFLSNRRYIQFFIESPQGLPAIIYILISTAIGVYVINKLTKVEY